MQISTLTCSSSPPTRALVVVRTLLLSFLVNFPFSIVPSISHEPWFKKTKQKTNQWQLQSFISRYTVGDCNRCWLFLAWLALFHPLASDPSISRNKPRLSESKPFPLQSGITTRHLSLSAGLIPPELLRGGDTHRDFSAIRQAVVEWDAQGEVDVFGAESAGLLDVELVAVLLDGDLQVVVLGELAFHDINAFIVERKRHRRVVMEALNVSTVRVFGNTTQLCTLAS